MPDAPPLVDHCGSCASCMLMNSLLGPKHSDALLGEPPVARKPADDRRYLAWMNTIQRELAEERTTPPKKPDALTPAQDLIASLDGRLARQPKVQQQAVCPPAHPKKDEPLKILYAGPQKYFSTRPLAQLKRIEIRSLSLRKRHEGRYLLVRVVSRLCKVVGISFVCQDPRGDALVVGLYSSPWALVSPGAELEAILPLGSILIIREPYLKPAPGGGTVLVDSPTDLVFLNEDIDIKGLLPWKGPAIRLPDQRPKTLTAEGYKVLGNGFLSKGWLIPADRAYSEGLRVDPSHIALRLNRCHARLKTGLWRSSLADSRSLLELGRTALPVAQREKALFRAASAEYSLQLWERAKVRFGELLACNPESKEAKDGLDRVASRIKEAKTGNYAWETLFSASQTNPALDIADWVLPDLRVEDRKGRGRSIIASKAIKAGSLLMMQKPLASCTYSDVLDGRDMACANLHSENLEGTSQAHLTQMIALRLMEDPSLADVFSLLYAGPNFPMPPSFSIYRLKPKEDVTSNPVDIDTARIEAVRTWNSFGRRRLGYALERGIDDDFPGEEGIRTRVPAALYVRPSLANHACDPSARFDFLGDSMYLRATRDLAAGDEVTINYASGCTYDDRTAVLKKHGIRCGASCVPCTEDRRDTAGNRSDRALLLNEIKLQPPPLTNFDQERMDLPSHNEAYRTMLKIVDDLSATYAPQRRRDHKWQMWTAYHALANVCSVQALVHPDASGQSDWAVAALQWENEALVSIGVGDLLATAYQQSDLKPKSPIDPGLVEHAIGSCLNIASVTKALGTSIHGHKRWLKAARVLDKNAGGHDLGLFKKRWAQFLTECQLDLKDIRE